MNQNASISKLSLEFFLALGGYFVNMLVLLEAIVWLVRERIRIIDYEYILGACSHCFKSLSP